MPLLTPSNNIEFKKAKIDIKSDTLNDIFDYCEFANINTDRSSNDISDFVEKCMVEMISKDKEWKKYKKEINDKIDINDIEAQ